MRSGADEVRKGGDPRTNPEKTALVISSLVVLTVLGLIVYDIFVRGYSPPVIEVQTGFDEIRRENGQYYLPVALINHGGQTAEDVTVAFTLTPAGEAPAESAGFTIRFLAPDERDVGVLVFTQDPAAGRLSHNVSYVRP